MIPHKHFVDVRAQFDTSGNITPLCILWPDGREFEIDRVLDVQNCASESGGAGRKYTVKIHGKQRNLFYVNDFNHDGNLCWYIESTKYFRKPDD